MESKLSIIIPVLNEEKILPLLLHDIKNSEKKLPFLIETIVVDGGSNDSTLQICQNHGVNVITAQRGRGQQLAAGAKAANGNYLMFLHADSRIQAEHCKKAIETLDSNSVIAGGFSLKFDDTHPILRLAEIINKIRFWMTKIIYGDHGIFLKREQYMKVGGFRRQALFEDIEFSVRLKKMGKVVMVMPALTTSSRRFRAGGVIRTYLKMAVMHLLYWIGVSPDKLAAWYQTQ